MKTGNNTHSAPGVKEIDLALRYMKEGRENPIPQDSFREATLKELEDFGLIERLSNGCYLITSKGTYAKQMGAYNYIELKRTERFFLKTSRFQLSSKRKFIATALALFLLLVLIILVTN